MKFIALIFFQIIAAIAAELPMHDSGTLYIFTLTVESSYGKNIERPAGEKYDTLQWWIGSQGAWRIRTYAIDADIHPYKVETDKPREALRKLAVENTKKHYGDVIGKMAIIEIPVGATDKAIAALLKKEGLNEKFEWAKEGYLLWFPDNTKYSSKTIPSN